MKKVSDKKVHPRVFQEGDLVFKNILLPRLDSRCKWTPNYEGPFVVKTAFSGSGLILTTMDGEELPHPENMDATMEGDLGKKERPSGLKTLKGRSRQKLGTYTKNYPGGLKT